MADEEHLGQVVGGEPFVFGEGAGECATTTVTVVYKNLCGYGVASVAEGEPHHYSVSAVACAKLPGETLAGRGAVEVLEKMMAFDDGEPTALRWGEDPEHLILQ